MACSRIVSNLVGIFAFLMILSTAHAHDLQPAVTIAIRTTSELVDAICAAKSTIPTVIDLSNSVLEFESVHSCSAVSDERDAITSAVPTIITQVTIKNGTIRRSLSLDRTARFRLLSVAYGGSLTLEDVSLERGIAPEGFADGGALVNHGILTARNVHFIDNAAPFGQGGAISSDGSFNISDSLLEANSALQGGAISLRPHSDESYAVANVIQKTTFTNNHARADTGAPAVALATNGGAIHNAGSLIVEESLFRENDAVGSGGAIYNDASAHNLVIKSSTMAANTANFGGGVANEGPLGVIANCTFSENHAPFGKGGGVYNNHQLDHVTNSTFTKNSSHDGGGGGIANDGTIVHFISNIVADNSAVANPDFENGGVVSSATHNLIGVDVATDFGQHTIIDGIDDNFVGIKVNPIKPLLLPLSNNGGALLTHALSEKSPAIDNGANPDSLAFDQRGSEFARIAGATTDIGAFECQDGCRAPKATVSITGAGSGGGGGDSSASPPSSEHERNMSSLAPNSADNAPRSDEVNAARPGDESLTSKNNSSFADNNGGYSRRMPRNSGCSSRGNSDLSLGLLIVVIAIFFDRRSRFTCSNNLQQF